MGDVAVFTDNKKTATAMAVTGSRSHLSLLPSRLLLRSLLRSRLREQENVHTHRTAGNKQSEREQRQQQRWRRTPENIGKCEGG